MPLIFSPLSENVLSTPTRKLLPRHAFLMRQLGDPPAIDLQMTTIVKSVFKRNKFKSIDAGDTAGQNDFLERILGLIRSTAFTVAIFSDQTRPETLANIMLELGFAAMCGKPLVIVKSAEAKAPSDLTRTDWIVFDPSEPTVFRRKLEQAVDEIVGLVEYETIQLDAQAIDCATALERATKAFLLGGEQTYIDKARDILTRIDAAPALPAISDMVRVRHEVDVFIRQATAAVTTAAPRRRNIHISAPVAATIPVV